MFGSLGWERLLVLAFLALIIFGPERLPTLARDAAQALKNLREMARGAQAQLGNELGPEFADLDLQTLNPRAFVRRHLLDDDTAGLLDDPFTAEPAKPAPSITPLNSGEPAPYDIDAT